MARQTNIQNNSRCYAVKAKSSCKCFLCDFIYIFKFTKLRSEWVFSLETQS